MTSGHVQQKRIYRPSKNTLRPNSLNNVKGQIQGKPRICYAQLYLNFLPLTAQENVNEYKRATPILEKIL